MHAHLQQLLHCIELEEKEQSERFRLDQQHSLKQLKAEGLALHPITVIRKNFGYADYPEISFKLPFPPEQSMFRDGAAIECFLQGEEPIKGILLNLEGKNGEFRLFAPDFPDWIEDKGVGIKLAPDTRTTTLMKQVLRQLPERKTMNSLFESIHGTAIQISATPDFSSPVVFKNTNLNQSQQHAVQAILQNEYLSIVHGPPGTGKTTTLIEAVVQLVKKGEKVVVAAPSNAAVDHLSRGLIREGIQLLRVGNVSKVDETLLAHTPEGYLNNSTLQKELKQLKKRAEEFRRMALQYKRNFGREEREQRQLLFKEVKSIREEIKRIQNYHEEKLFDQAQVIAGTPIGLYDAGLHKLKFQTLVIDEAGQCIEPFAWCIFPLAEKWVLAGDHWQLPPTVLSAEAVAAGFNVSILEAAIRTCNAVRLLDVQYRMRDSIAGFSSHYFYQGLLKTAGHLMDQGVHLVFIDTAGSGYEEEPGGEGTSLQNKGELNLVRQLLETEQLNLKNTALITPYSGQVAAARELFPQDLRISTIDSFQGQEKEVVILSLVRSNDSGEIGFLKDYRRMNVAMTRAQEKLFVIGDSATIGGDKFYSRFLEFVESRGLYRTVWEFEV